MLINSEVQTIIDQSLHKQSLEAVIQLVNELLKQHQIVPTELQWTILINHLNEMVNRSVAGETIPEVDPAMFSEISAMALQIADAVVNHIGSLSKDEVYVLSIHFEAAKQNVEYID
ncbi:PRD domain-containing protein [Enterococcus faecalis]